MSADDIEQPVPESLRSRFSRTVRLHLLEKAAELFQRDGYRAVTVKSIARAAGTTHTTFYKFFDSKFQLIIEAGRASLPEHEALVERLSGIDPADVKAVRGWLDEYVILWDRRQAIYEAYWEAAYGEPDVVAEIYRQAVHMAGVFRAGIDGADRVVDEAATRELAMIVLALSPMMSVIMRERDLGARASILDLAASVLSRSLTRSGGW